MGKLVKVAETKDIPAGEAGSFEVEGQTIAIFNVDGKYYAIDDACPHSGGPLSEGEVDASKNVTCPWHEAQFSLESGDVLSPPAFEGVNSYPVVVEGDDIKVEI